MSDAPNPEHRAYLPWFSRLTRYVGPRLPSGIRRRFRRLMFNSRTLRLQLPSDLDIRIASIDDWAVYQEIFVQGEYDLAITKAVEARGTADRLCFVDIGANIGLFTLRLVDRLRSAGASCRPVGTLIEGNRVLVGELQRRLVEANRLTDLRIVCGLAGRREGAAILSAGAEHGHGSIMFSSAPGDESVPFIDLDVLLAAEPEIDLLKIDIEGAEQLLLETYADLLRKVRVVTLEVHAHVSDATRCKALLREAGFQQASESPVSAFNFVYTAWR